MPSRLPVHQATLAHLALRQPVSFTVPARLSPSRRGYDKRWARMRAWYLARNPMCAVSGCNRPAVDVHHVVRLAEGGSSTDAGNMQGLCHSCHSRETRRTMGNR
jgi:5-methylcytosine-specific restriction endonuclease McrA